MHSSSEFYRTTQLARYHIAYGIEHVDGVVKPSGVQLCMAPWKFGDRPQGRGRGGGEATIVQIGSLAGMMPYVFGSVYNASKAALHGFSDTLRVELAPFGVRVVTIITGSVSSRLFEINTKVPEGSLYYPLKERIEKHDFLDGSSWTSAEEYAKQVYSDLKRA